MGSFGFITPELESNSPDSKLDTVFCNAKDMIRPPIVHEITTAYEEAYWKIKNKMAEDAKKSSGSVP